MTTERIPGRVEVQVDEPTQPQTSARQPGRIEEATVALAEQAPSTVERPSKKSATSVWARAGWMLLFTAAVWLLVSTGLSLWQLWQDFWWLALGLGGLSTAVLVFLVRAVHVEWQASKRLDAVAARQQQIGAALEHEDLLAFNQCLKPLLSELQQQYPERVQAYRDALVDRETVASRIQLAENTWLAELDKEAARLIKQEALTVGGGVALLPHPFFDALLVLWRSQRLIRRLGEVYGLRPTGLSSWKLLKMTLINTLIASSMETATELAAEQLGYGVAESAVGKGAVQGAVMAQRMRRLGRQAQRLCRPWRKAD